MSFHSLLPAALTLVPNALPLAVYAVAPFVDEVSIHTLGKKVIPESGSLIPSNSAGLASFITVTTPY